jgi:ribosomal-protein-alanine N-acetyltransferase
MKIRTLQVDDATALLEFELLNRSWFEQSVLPRAESFYSIDGVAAHIDTCLHDYTLGTMHPCIILDNDGQIVGRANLKDIDEVARTTEIGYRIGQAYVGKGVATEAVIFLQDLAYSQWKLKRLLAFVTTENLASARVLEKCGFMRGELIPSRSELKNKILDAYQYQHMPTLVD